MKRERESGFTLIEVMVAMIIMVIGLTGVLMMQASVTRGNRQSAQITRCAQIAEERMEQLRGTPINTLTLNAATAMPPNVTDKGITYSVTYTVTTPLAADPNLALIEVVASYNDDGIPHNAKVQLVRTTLESM
jgi:type IV pilus assembly protein PilV